MINRNLSYISILLAVVAAILAMLAIAITLLPNQRDCEWRQQTIDDITACEANPGCSITSDEIRTRRRMEDYIARKCDDE